MDETNFMVMFTPHYWVSNQTEEVEMAVKTAELVGTVSPAMKVVKAVKEMKLVKVKMMKVVKVNVVRMVKVKTVKVLKRKVVRVVKVKIVKVVKGRW